MAESHGSVEPQLPVSLSGGCATTSLLLFFLNRILKGVLRAPVRRRIASTVFLFVMHMIATALFVVMATALVQTSGMRKHTH